MVGGSRTNKRLIPVFLRNIRDLLHGLQKLKTDMHRDCATKKNIRHECGYSGHYANGCEYIKVV